MDRNSLYLISLTILNTLSVSILAALNEARLDVYISMFVLIYFALTAMFKPRRRTFDFLAIALFISFSYIVAIKVLEILFKP